MNDINLRTADVNTLSCPACRGTLTYRGTPVAGALGDGHLRCEGCENDWPVIDGVPRLLSDEESSGLQRLEDLFFEATAATHESGARATREPVDIDVARREELLERLDLHSIHDHEPGRPVRILDVGAGTGSNLAALARVLPAQFDTEVWALAPRPAMIEQCRRRTDGDPGGSTRFVVAGAHRLPFADRSFDRVFHIGGLHAWADPRRGLEEMARVARPDAPVLLVEEREDSVHARWLYEQLLYRLLAFGDAGAVSWGVELRHSRGSAARGRPRRVCFCLRFTVRASSQATGNGSSAARGRSPTWNDRAARCGNGARRLPPAS